MTRETILAEATGVILHSGDIERGQQAEKPASDKKPLVIFRFRSYKAREKFYQNHKGLRVTRSILPAEVVRSCFIWESMTKRKRQVFYVASQTKRAHCLYSVWTDCCKITNCIKVAIRKSGRTDDDNRLGLRPRLLLQHM